MADMSSVIQRSVWNLQILFIIQNNKGCQFEAHFIFSIKDIINKSWKIYLYGSQLPSYKIYCTEKRLKKERLIFCYNYNQLSLLHIYPQLLYNNYIVLIIVLSFILPIVVQLNRASGHHFRQHLHPGSQSVYYLST